MVAAISTPIHPKRAQTPTPRRTPLLPSESDNALAPPRRPKAREITSRYMSSSSSSSSSVSSPPRRCHSPLVVTRAVNSTKQTPTPALKRCQSAERRRQGTPRPTLTDAPAAQKVLFTSTRSLSVSFQGESFPIQVRTTKPPPSQSLRKSTPERRKVATTPTPVRNGNSDHAENTRSGIDRHRWPAKSLSRPQQVNCVNRSLECVDSTGRKQTDASENVVRSLQNVMADVRASHDATLRSESNKINGSEFRPEAELEPIASDTESVTSGSSSGDGIRGSRGIVMPARFWQEHNNRLRRQTEAPSSRNGVIGNKGTVSTAPSPRILVQRKSVLDSAVSSPRGVVNSRVVQGSPIRSAVRPASPSKLATPSVWSPSRGVSPSRAQNGVTGGMSSRSGSEPSVLSFAVDVSRGKVGENRIADAHLLRLFYNRLLQWRFVNARADSALSAQTFNAEESLKAAWVAMSKIRESVRAKKTEFQLLKQQFKLINILKDQMLYLEDWATLDRVYSTSLSGATEALRASTLRLPVVGGAKPDLLNLKDAICSAMDVMQAMASSICILSPKVGQLNSMVVEVANLSAKERVLLEECKDLLSVITTLQVRECSLRTHVAQLKCQPRSTEVKITTK
ncbi:QWRF motif-containing protein 2-like [Vigna unguiculata]|uniref:QWRF motif-containing protein 2-like n=1 Tax=Vigna unguiculata TaxID=3917 RepID=UPI001016BDE0|nr:QWRF motif-containing protein 2-like [Vigna unguiculata]